MSDLKVQAQESLWQKFWFIVLDKALLAGLIVILGGAATFAATVLSDRFKTVWAFQEKLFDKRFEAYSELQLRADNILQELAIYYDAPNDPGNPIAYEPWPNTLDKLISRYENLNNTGSGFGTATWSNINDVFEPLKNLLNTKQHYALLIPTALDSAINNFVKSVTTSIDMDLAQAETKKKLGEGEQDSVRKQRWADIFFAYRELKAHLRATLGLDLTPVNIRGM